ncbi:nucleotidyltransferase domain-containing protein [Desulfobacca acetoxidans]|uniref:DNA polymerase beta domain protein region n=1 Tax=Desulfobacca acetoxidans (strain ATCC 700848 / DSM 11109 / ASRB2) TaxID=880072 RepID=F2NDU3_DESAR|nr:nucleotidyltransferase domain-containing protein [Desulfobacca acetoxidans]AEB10440.1 DNA polymerase beta domain protein region [Desulfobacca acetoxidans DSM 11109]
MIFHGELNKLINEIIQKLTGQIDLEKIVLFGSQVTGRTDEYSDIDILIIAPSRERPLDRRLKVRRLLHDLDKNIGLDILFYTPEEVERFKDHPSSFLHHILATGVTVYDRKPS